MQRCNIVSSLHFCIFEYENKFNTCVVSGFKAEDISRGTDSSVSGYGTGIS